MPSQMGYTFMKKDLTESEKQDFDKQESENRAAQTEETRKKGPSEEEPSIEEAFDRISKLLAQMEQEDCSLEDSFKCYEEGMKLIKYCNGRIDRVEKRVLALNTDGELNEF